MNAKRLASGIVVTGILGVALLAGIGTTATTAEAGPKRDRVVQRENKKPKMVRGDQVRQRRSEAVRDRRTQEQRRRVDVQHRSVVRHRVEVRRHRYDDRRVIVRRVPYPVRYHRPWYVNAPRFYVDRSPFYFNAGLGVYLGGVFLNLELTNAAPEGYVYVDPYCGAEFWTIDAYRAHLRYHHHRPALRLVQVGYCGN